MRVVGQTLGVALGLLWVLFMVAVPLLAVWLATSLISLHGGPRTLALLGGLLLFPVLPLLWEHRATRAWKAENARKRQFGAPPKRALSTLDRLLLRTLVLSVAFSAALLVWFPKTAFLALATRGDWFLQGSREPWAQTVRGACFAAAGGLEWLHSLANPNPYRRPGDDVPPPTDLAPAPEKPREKVARRWLPGTGPWRRGREEPREQAPLPPPPEPDPGVVAAIVPGADAVWNVGRTAWPWPDQPDPVLASMGPADEASIEAVARFVAARRRDPFQRVKALHDWVVTRLRYEHESLQPGARRPQDSPSVFSRRAGVCEGYARLLVALGRASGDRIVYLTGDVREENGQAAPVGHAWNAVEILGAWYLLDATWDDPTTPDRRPTYRTDYLFIPPSIAVYDHLPDEPRWQLLDTALSRGDFVRQPMARPGLAREGMTLLEPQRPAVEVADELLVLVENPRRRHVMVRLAGEGGADVECGIDDGARVSIRCPVGAAGRHAANIFSNRERTGTYGSLASIEVVRR